MYYVNEEQIEARLDFAEKLAADCELILKGWDQASPIYQFAQERALHLAIETVTDVGSLMIDGFIMRDAASYEDIVEILRDERVFDEATASVLQELVKLRKPLVQEFTVWERGIQHPLLHGLPVLLRQFAESVRRFIKSELGKP